MTGPVEEPPVGGYVVDATGELWRREHHGWVLLLPSLSGGVSWERLLARWGVVQVLVPVEGGGAS